MQNLTQKPNISHNEKNFISDYAKTMAVLTTQAQRPEVSPELLRIQRDPSNIIRINELVIKPEPFDGERPRPRRWLSDYEEAISANGWSEAIAIKYFPTFLEGAAKDWYFTDVRTQRIHGWHDVKKLYSLNYLGESDYQQLSVAIDKMTQQAGESVSTFIPRLRRLQLMLTPDLPEREQIRQIRLKLRPEYTALLAFAEVNSLAALKLLLPQNRSRLYESRRS